MEVEYKELQLIRKTVLILGRWFLDRDLGTHILDNPSLVQSKNMRYYHSYINSEI